MPPAQPPPPPPGGGRATAAPRDPPRTGPDSTSGDGPTSPVRTPAGAVPHPFREDTMTDQQTPASTVSAEDVTEAMKDVIDPELGINVVDLGLVYGVTVEDGNAVIDMTLTSAACPLTDVLEEQTFAVLDPITETHRINWVWMPPWGMEKITEDGREQLRAIGFNL